MRLLHLLRPFCLAAACLSAVFAHAAGFGTIDIPADREGPAMQGAVWTPCAAPAGEIKLGRNTIQGVRDCPLPPGNARLPLIVISHGYGGSFLGHHDTRRRSPTRASSSRPSAIRKTTSSSVAARTTGSSRWRREPPTSSG